jgi:hypothetical protein
LKFQVRSSIEPGTNFGRGRGFAALKKSISYNSGPGNFSAVTDNWKNGDIPCFVGSSQRSSGFSETKSEDFVKSRGGARGGEQGGFSSNDGGVCQGWSNDECGDGKVIRHSGFKSCKAGESGKLFLFLSYSMVLYKGVSKTFQTELIMKYTLTTINTY